MGKKIKKEPVPESASATIRRRMVEILSQWEMSALDLSQELGVAEKIILSHLPHVIRSVGSKGQKVVIQPAGCLACGFQFKERDRLTRPGRCPQCKKSHISPPRFRIL